MRVGRLPVAFAVALVALGGQVRASTMLLTEHTQSRIHRWNPQSGVTSLYHSATSNDADYNVLQGSSEVWIAEHFGDTFGSFAAGSGSGIDQQYSVPFHYPKHVSVFSNHVFVMSRNDGTVHQYDLAGNPVTSFATGFIGQGMATNGVDLFVSVWNGGSSLFQRYDSNLVLQETLANPTGLGFTNVFDFAYDHETNTFRGLATNGEAGTGTNSSTVVEFTMGGSVLSSSTLAFQADGIGQFDSAVPEPSSLALLGVGVCVAVAGVGYRGRRGARQLN